MNLSDNIEGAWAFLRMLYEYDELHTIPGITIPMNKLSFNTLTDLYINQKTAAINDDKGAGFYGPADAVHVPPISVETVYYVAESINEMAANIDRLFLLDLNICNIILEELPPYIYNLTSAKKTAQVIQNRVQTYLWEMN